LAAALAEASAGVGGRLRRRWERGVPEPLAVPRSGGCGGAVALVVVVVGWDDAP